MVFGWGGSYFIFLPPSTNPLWDWSWSWRCGSKIQNKDEICSNLSLHQSILPSFPSYWSSTTSSIISFLFFIVWLRFHLLSEIYSTNQTIIEDERRGKRIMEDDRRKSKELVDWCRKRLEVDTDSSCSSSFFILIINCMICLSTEGWSTSSNRFLHKSTTVNHFFLTIGRRPINQSQPSVDSWKDWLMMVRRWLTRVD